MIDADAAGFGREVAMWLDRDPHAATSAVLELLAAGPRVKPSHGLVIDPKDDARRAWDRRVAAVAALAASRHAVRVLPELVEELREDAQLAADVLACSRPHPSLTSALSVNG